MTCGSNVIRSKLIMLGLQDITPFSQSDQIPSKGIAGGHTIDSEWILARKVTNVVRHDDAAPDRDRESQDHVVISVGEERTPQKVYLLQVGLTCNMPWKTKGHFR